MKQELSSQLAKKNGGTVGRCDRPTDKEKAFTPFGGVSRLELLSMLLMCAGLVRPRPPGSAVLIMITPKATSGEREEGGGAGAGGERAQAVLSQLPSMIYGACFGSLLKRRRPPDTDRRMHRHMLVGVEPTDRACPGLHDVLRRSLTL